jgi:hypothetical protein
VVLRSRLSLLAAVAATAASLLAALPGTAYAAGTVPSEYVGADISWPQCGGSTPTDRVYQFAIIGVTGGQPFSPNPCLATEYRWAAASGFPELYVNLQYGETNNGPLHCSDQDTGCLAYNYGYETVEWAVRYASDSTGGATNSAPIWWLDVETENAWSNDPDQNAYVIQGALDYLQLAFNRGVGVYSTSYQWSEIAGSFAPPGIPNWVAGAAALNDSNACLSPIWPGAQVWAVQYLNLDLDLDQDVGC